MHNFSRGSTPPAQVHSLALPLRAVKECNFAKADPITHRLDRLE